MVIWSCKGMGVALGHLGEGIRFGAQECSQVKGRLLAEIPGAAVGNSRRTST